MTNVIRLAAIVACLAAPTAWARADLIDAINPGAAPPFAYYGGPTNIGWYYTPAQSYTLTGIYTYFEPVPNGTGDHTITAQIQTDRPAVGGMLLDSGTFMANSAEGGYVGVTFAAPIDLTAGTTYFVDFLNTEGMGVDVGQWANDPQGNPRPSNGATVNLGSWAGGFYGDTTFSDLVNNPSYGTLSNGQNISFAEPILYFNGFTTSVPEPSSIVNLSICLAALAVARRWVVRH